jgi:hypothetical protein
MNVHIGNKTVTLDDEVPGHIVSVSEEIVSEGGRQDVTIQVPCLGLFGKES